MHRLICAFVVRIWQKQVFSWRGSLMIVNSHWLFSLGSCCVACLTGRISLCTRMNSGELMSVMEHRFLQIFSILTNRIYLLRFNSRITYGQDLYCITVHGIIRGLNPQWRFKLNYCVVYRLSLKSDSRQVYLVALPRPCKDKIIV